MRNIIEVPRHTPREDETKEPGEHTPAETLYLEFPNGEKRAEAMEAINGLRKKYPDIFANEISYEIDRERPYEGIAIAFKEILPERAERIREKLHEAGIQLNMRDGVEEEIHYKKAA